jgi:hypothetical protein
MALQQYGGRFRANASRHRPLIPEDDFVPVS